MNPCRSSERACPHQTFTTVTIAVMKNASVSRPGEKQMGRELNDLLATARTGELEPAEFARRLESLHARFLGADADAPATVKARQDAVEAYEHLIEETDLDGHHHLEALARALGVE